MSPHFTEVFGNPSPMHSFGERSGTAVATARRALQVDLDEYSKALTDDAVLVTVM
jgi:cysteine sulfinate desulfinase/cysteine desulfurase-like protein